jgi:hypothetical protein
MVPWIYKGYGLAVLSAQIHFRLGNAKSPICGDRIKSISKIAQRPSLRRIVPKSQGLSGFWSLLEPTNLQ